MASKKQIATWEAQAEKINKNPEYIRKYIEYKQLAKKADQRLVRLEALSHEKHFHGVLEFAYKRAVKDIQACGGDKRFNTAPPRTVTELNAKISDIEYFLSRPTSKKTTIVKTYKKRAETINNKSYIKNLGVKFTWEEIANYYESNAAERNDTKYGSKTVLRALAVLKKLNKADDAKKIEDVNKRVQRVSEDKVVNKVAAALLEEGYDYNELMKK